MKTERNLRFVIMVIQVVGAVSTVLDLLFTSVIDNESNQSGSLPSEFTNYPLDIIQITMGILVIYFLTVYNKYISRIARKDDPFSNSDVLSFIVFVVVFQKYLIEFFQTNLLGTSGEFEQLTVVVRQTIMSIELLCVIIPIRHNFSLNYIEIE